MREKYVEERFHRYFIFGGSIEKDCVDVSDSEGDVLQCVTLANANSIIAERDKIVDFVWKMACAFEEADKEAFDKFWYDTSYDEEN